MGLNIWNVKSQQLCSRRTGRVRGHREGELLSPGRHSSAQRGTKVLASAIFLSHLLAEIPKVTSSRHQTSLHRANAQRCPSVDPSLQRVCLPPCAAGPLTQVTTDGKASYACPSCPCAPCGSTPANTSDTINATPQAWQCASSPDRGQTTPQ